MLPAPYRLNLRERAERIQKENTPPRETPVRYKELCVTVPRKLLSTRRAIPLRIKKKEAKKSYLGPATPPILPPFLTSRPSSAMADFSSWLCGGPFGHVLVPERPPRLERSFSLCQNAIALGRGFYNPKRARRKEWSCDVRNWLSFRVRCRREI